MVDKRRVGYIGLGNMGGGMARTLLRAGYVPNVFDIDQSKMGSLKSLGASPFGSPREVAERSDVVLSCLGFPSTVKEVYLGPNGVIEGSSPDMILIDMSTVDPETSRSINKVAAEKKIYYLDAPVSGSFKQAEAGTLVIMVGGDEDAFKRSKEILDLFGSPIHYAGPSGAGNIVKIVNNIMTMGSQLVAAEAFVLGVKSGLDAQTLFNIIRTCAGPSPYVNRKLSDYMLARNFEPGFTVALAKKDLGLAVDMAKNLTVPVPATSLFHQLYNVSSSLGDDQKDCSSIVKVFESWAKVQLQGEKEC